jgi:site-specific recombinase XerC
MFRWALEEGEITTDPMARMRLPSVPEDPPEILIDAELRALLKACEGQEFVARRDTAIIMTFIDTGARLSEMAGVKLDDVDLDDQTLTVTGKGSRVRAAHCAYRRYTQSTDAQPVRRGLGWRLEVILPEHPDQHRPERQVLLAIDQELRERAFAAQT